MARCERRIRIPYVTAHPTEAEIAWQIEEARTWKYRNLPPPPIGIVFRQAEVACGAAPDIPDEPFPPLPPVFCSIHRTAAEAV